MSKIIVANWKMNVGTRESVALARGALLALRGQKVAPELVLCAPFVALSELRKALARSRVHLGAQDIFWEDAGAYTGEISGRMLTEHGVSHVIIGHSERREHVGENDEMINKKIKAALAQKLTAIVCVGETKEAREEGKQEEVLRYQVGAALEGLRLREHDRLMIAYEPVWAISTTKSGEETPTDAARMHTLIRSVATEHLGASAAHVQVLYGGSVDGQNAFSFLREDAIDGLLVGSASLKLSQLTEILSAASDVIESRQN